MKLWGYIFYVAGIFAGICMTRPTWKRRMPYFLISIVLAAAAGFIGAGE